MLYQTIEIAMIDHNDNLGFLFLTAFPHHFRFWTKAKVFFDNSIKKDSNTNGKTFDHQISVRYFNSRLALEPPITK